MRAQSPTTWPPRGETSEAPHSAPRVWPPVASEVRPARFSSRDTPRPATALGPRTTPPGQVAGEVVPPTQADVLAQAHQRGLAEGRAALEQELGTARLAAISGMVELVLQLRRRAAEVGLELATAMAGRILAREVRHEPGWIARNALACLDLQVPNGPLKLRLHPEDRDQLLDPGPPPEWLSGARGAVSLVADPSLERGDCVLESERGRIDGRLTSQVERLRDLVADAVSAEFAAEATP
jgi:flagellar assembly protein FliH